MIHANRDPFLLRLKQKELRKLYPHLVGQLHLQQQQKPGEFSTEGK